MVHRRAIRRKLSLAVSDYGWLESHGRIYGVLVRHRFPFLNLSGGGGEVEVYGNSLFGVVGTHLRGIVICVWIGSPVSPEQTIFEGFFYFQIGVREGINLGFYVVVGHG